MTKTLFVPDSIGEASTQLIFALAKPLTELSHDQFVRAWSSLAYLFPELHPDDTTERRGGWPRAFKPLAVEAQRRAEAGELDDEEYYPSDAQWCGLYDRMLDHTPEETERRNSFARKPGIEVGDIVRYTNPFPDEVGSLMVIIEWNDDRGFAKHLGTKMKFAPTALVRIGDIEVVHKAHA